MSNGSLHFAAWAAVVWLAGVCPAQPAADFADTKLSEERRIQAIDQAWREVEAGTADRAPTREALKKLVWTIGRPSEKIRVRAVQTLLRDTTPEGAADNINLLRLRLPTESSWPVIDAICNAAAARAADPAWKVLTAPLVRSYSRMVPTPPDEDRPERAALLALHSGTTTDDLAVIVFNVFVDPVKNGADAGEMAEKARQAAWESLGRIDPDGSKRSAIISAHPELAAHEAVAELARLRDALSMVPVTGSELELVRRMAQQKSPIEQSWWASATAAVQGLGTDQRAGLGLRHVEPVRWAAEHRPAWLSADRAVLLAELEGRLKGRRHWRAGATDGGTRKHGETLKEWKDQLAWGDVLAILIIDEVLREPGVVSELFSQAGKDRADTSTEYGGLLWAVETQSVDSAATRAAEGGAFRASLFEPRPTQRKNDRTFIAAQDMLDADARTLAHYHFHVQTPANSEYAGPGAGDLEYARSHRRSCLVLTSVRAGSMNVDYYQWDGAVIDLGEIRADQ